MLLSILAAALMPMADAPADPNLADLQCAAVFAAVGAGTNAPETLQGLTGAFMYYVGRIDARDPLYDIEGQLIRLLKGGDYATQFQADAKRCSAEMQQRGAEIEAIGKAIEASSPLTETLRG